MSDALYLTDQEIAVRLGIATGLWRKNAAVLESSGLPRGDPLFGGRRYWPAVRRFLDVRAGLGGASPAPLPDGQEHWEDEHA